MTIAVDWSDVKSVSAFADRKAQRECKAFVVVEDLFGFKIIEPESLTDKHVIYHRANYISPYG